VTCSTYPLIVEDNETNRKLARDVLRAKGYQTKPIRLKEFLGAEREMPDRT
jgi:CheY-like chemotaxis protein